MYTCTYMYVWVYTYVGLYVCKYACIYEYEDILNINKYIKYVFIILILLESNKQNIEYIPSLITYPLGGGYVLFSPLFLTALSLSLSLSLSVCHFIPSFWNNSATVREGVTKFEMPRQKLLNKCMFLFIAPFDL